MSPKSNRPTNREEPQTDRVGDLIRMGGRRSVPAAERVARSRSRVEAHWRSSIRSRSRRRNIVWFTLAAAAGLTVLLWAGRGMINPGTSSRAIAAEVVRVEGSVQIARADGVDPSSLTRSAIVELGAQLQTSKSARVALALKETGHSVRVDQNTVVEIVGPETLVLQHGALYIDSGVSSERAIPVRVQTPFGVIQDIGTQFEVQVRPDENTNAMRVRVREGAVVVRTANGTHRLERGEQGQYSQTGKVETSRITAYGEEWGWVRGFVPPFRIEGIPATEFLEWGAREGGWSLDLSSQAARIASEAILSGDVDGLTIEEALSTVLPTCGLAYEIDAQRLVVTAERESS